MIDIRRTWLKKNLLNSDYIVETETTETSRYPKKILLLKDIRIVMHDNLKEDEKKEIEAKSILKFGPILMKNQFFLNKHSKESFIKPITNKVAYHNLALKIDSKLAITSLVNSNVNLKPTNKVFNKRITPVRPPKQSSVLSKGVNVKSKNKGVAFQKCSASTQCGKSKTSDSQFAFTETKPNNSTLILGRYL